MGGRVYRLSTEADGTQSWQAVGTPIDLQQFSDDGLNVGDIDGAGGESVSISGDGTVVAIGYPGTSQNGASVRVFELGANNQDWIQRGPTLRDPNDPDPNSPSSFGKAVSLSGDGNTLAIGTPDDQGFVHVYQYNQSGDDYGYQLTKKEIQVITISGLMVFRVMALVM